MRFTAPPLSEDEWRDKSKFCAKTCESFKYNPPPFGEFPLNILKFSIRTVSGLFNIEIFGNKVNRV